MKIELQEPWLTRYKEYSFRMFMYALETGRTGRKLDGARKALKNFYLLQQQGIQAYFDNKGKLRIPSSDLQQSRRRVQKRISNTLVGGKITISK